MKNESAPSFIPPTMLVQNFARPAGVSLLDAMVHQYEKDTGRKSQLPAATITKIEGPASASTRPTSLYSFIRSGQIAAGTTERDMRVMLDLARDLILSYAEQARGAAAPAPSAPATTTTAAAMLAAIAKPKMTVAEFNKIPHAQRGEIIKKITLID